VDYPNREAEMKVAILAGGLGTRLSEETVQRPKPLVEIGGMPILWHVMSHYAGYGLREFVIATGYKKEMLARYFIEYHQLSRNVTVDLGSGEVSTHGGAPLDWRVNLIDTGANTMTGGRIKRLKPYLGNETFMLTWCDGLSNVDLNALLAFHRRHGKLATVTIVRSPARFGHVVTDNHAAVTCFDEKPEQGDGWINGAFFVLEPGVFDYIDGDATMWEHEPMRRLAEDNQLMAYRHESFWQCMDSLREKQLLENLWTSGKAPWKTWE
jgi:glucose-1-phosphate cytidylyltransferase